jgi:hypothetical protein
LVTALAVALLAASCGTASPRAANPSPTPSIPSPRPSPSPTPVQIPPIPEGRYEVDVSRADAIRFHVEEQDINENTGHFTLTFRNGYWTLVQSGHPVSNPILRGIYFGSGHTLILQFQTVNTGTDTCRWKFDRKSGTLLITVLRAEPGSGDPVDASTALAVDRAIFQSHPWQKAG